MITTSYDGWAQLCPDCGSVFSGYSGASNRSASHGLEFGLVLAG